MNIWHPLPPPAMIPVMYLGSQVFQAGFYLGLAASGGFVLACLLFRLAWSFLSCVPRSAVSTLLLFACICAPAFAGNATVQAGTSGVVPLVSRASCPPSNTWTISGESGTIAQGTLGSAGSGWVVSSFVEGVSASVSVPATASPSVTYQLIIQSPGGNVNSNFFNVSPPAPASSASPCTSGYPASVAPLLGSAPSPCQYFDASQGFNKSSAPLITAVLVVLAVILAIWLGHDTVMSIFRRLLTGMTGG